MTDLNAQFHWKCEPEAENTILHYLEQAADQSSFVKHLEETLRSGCSAELISFTDHITIPYSQEVLQKAERDGFKRLNVRSGAYHLYHPGAMLPHLVLRESLKGIELYISVESIAHFLMVHHVQAKIEGTPFSGYRRALVADEQGVKTWVIERRGVHTLEPTYQDPEAMAQYLSFKEAWEQRKRSSIDERKELVESLQLASKMVQALGQAPAAFLAMEGERYYWQMKNRAGQIQKARQDAVGMGWANHDHHTFRSSRTHFAELVRLFEILGFHCRERFYAGEEAGWGAQVMENPEARLVLFLDVDLSPEEITIDFAHEALPLRNKLGTIGLWCALHGDSILKSGMHHLEAQFSFERLKEDLATKGVKMMDPFSNFPYLKQAFTEGERWKVEERMIKALLKDGKITEAEAERFRTQGAVGSHMENLERKEGYKGFNQKNVSLIIKKTDPRTLVTENHLPPNG